jgi:hypothetical protein
MFVISYVGDEGIAKALHGLTRVGVTLLVRTCDPNVTETLVCSAFDLDTYYVEILGVSAGRSYEQLLSNDKSDGTVEALLASNGRIEGMADAMTCCRRLRKAVHLSLAVQLIGAILGLVLTAFLVFHAGQVLPPLYIIGYQLLWTVLSWICPLFKRI